MDAFIGFEKHAGQYACATCPACGVVWHFNTHKDARIFAQTHANECGECHTHGAVEDQFFCAYDEIQPPHAWGPPDVLALEVKDWETMVARATIVSEREARSKMVERARLALHLAAEELELRHHQHHQLVVDRETGKVSPR